MTNDISRQHTQTIKQTTLTSNAPMILDATCSFSHIWPKHATVRIDIRPECKPQIVMDARDLKFPDNYFDEIYCDPPHFIRKNGTVSKMIINRRLDGKRSPDPITRYGVWKNIEEWYDFIEKTNNEFCRVIKPNGILHYKMTEGKGCMTITSLLNRMTNFELIEDKSKYKGISTMGKGILHFLKFKVKFTEIDSDTWDGAN
jgi:hypothetical protein